MKNLPGPEQNDMSLKDFKSFLDNLTIDKFVTSSKWHTT